MLQDILIRTMLLLTHATRVPEDASPGWGSTVISNATKSFCSTEYRLTHYLPPRTRRWRFLLRIFKQRLVRLKHWRFLLIGGASAAATGLSIYGQT